MVSSERGVSAPGGPQESAASSSTPAEGHPARKEEILRQKSNAKFTAKESGPSEPLEASPGPIRGSSGAPEGSLGAPEASQGVREASSGAPEASPEANSEVPGPNLGAPVANSEVQEVFSGPPGASSATTGAPGPPPAAAQDNNEPRRQLAPPQHDSWVSPEESWAQMQLPSPPRGTAAKDAAAAAKRALAESAAAAHAAEQAAADAAAAAAAAAAEADAAAARDAAAAAANLEAAEAGETAVGYVFIFTNPTSGGNKAAAFTRTAVSRLTLREPFRVEVFIHDIREGQSGSKPGFLLLKAVADRVASSSSSSSSTEQNKDQRTIRVLVAGGDGTVMWCLEEMQKTGVLPNACAVGVVPYGTGNDFANAFGWRPFNAANPFDSSLHTIVEHSMKAHVVFHDLWSVKVSLKPGGYFSRINPNTRKKEVVEREGKPVQELSFTMSNYFSMGVESRIGRGFDRHRTKSQAFNKMRYGIEGFKKAFWTRTQNINSLILNLTVHPNTPQEEILFTTDKSKAKEKQIPLLKKTASLVLLNIPSFSGGNDIWAPSKKLAVSQPNKQKQQQAKALLQVPQRMGDERLEFMTFKSIPSMGIEFTDGEYYQLSLPSSVFVSHNRRVQVLSLNPPEKRAATETAPDTA
ncbi:diacylglycerol kinase, putative [Eimeria praecox]|uniref:Diacylglycerol kinase n=1 Tax=Eimeria praecox TaxID=51316 RepID=U6GWZ3_9EIME|nr:diacylglycerol kinase, putative [Eimeria praecox]